MVVVIQVQARRAQIHLDGLLLHSEFGRQYHVDAWTQAALMHRPRLVEIEVFLVGLLIEFILEEVQTLQGVRLLDEHTAQDAVPTPMLVDGAFGFVQIEGHPLLLVHEALLLKKNPRPVEQGIEHPFPDIFPMRPLLSLIECPPLVLEFEGLRGVGLHPIQGLAGAPQTPCRQSVGVPVVVDVVLVLIRSRDAEHHPCLFRPAPIDPLCPEAGHTQDDFPSSIGHVGFVTGISDVIVDGIHHGPIPVDFLKGDFPLVVAFLTVHGHHRI